jgi:hypothetical protein
MRFKNILFLVLFIMISSLVSSAATKPDIAIIESGISDVATHVGDTSGISMFFYEQKFNPTTNFVKDDRIYFTPENEAFTYWCLFNHGSFFSKIFKVNVILPNGSIAWKDMLVLPSTKEDKTHLVCEGLYLKDKIKSKKIKQQDYGKWKIQIYLGKRLLDEKTFYVDTIDNLAVYAKNNGESEEEIQTLKNIERNRPNKTHHIIVKNDGVIKFVFLGIPREEVIIELGEPKKTKIDSKGVEILYYLTSTRLYISREWQWDNKRDSKYISEIIEKKEDSKKHSWIKLHIKDGMLTKFSK